MSNKVKKYLIDNEYFTKTQLVKLSGCTYYSVINKLALGVSTLSEIKNKNFGKGVGPNYKESMMNDRHGHWKLLSRALGC